MFRKYIVYLHIFFEYRIMANMKFNYGGVSRFLSDNVLENESSLVEKAYHLLVSESGAGNDYTGWLSLPVAEHDEELQHIQQVVARLLPLSEVVVVIGIGGSYLGARAVIEALQPHFPLLNKESNYPDVLFAGNHLSEDYLFDLQKVLDEKDYSIVVISKSGTTTEPAIGFRLLKEHCEKKYGKSAARERIIAITDSTKGALKKMAIQEGYDTFVIPENVGGRYSVLTPVGLLPIALAGFNIHDLIEGAAQMHKMLIEKQCVNDNIAMQYAFIRNYLYRQGKKVELMVAYEPRLSFFIEWYKQLFGESEGKENKGIFPAGCIFSTDLHSLGQYIQEGERMLFETVISVEHTKHTLPIPYDAENLDGLNYLQHRTINEINHVAEEATRLAHIEGGVPNLQISIPQINESTLGEMIYFFEFSCALGGYMLGINPFNQPGVEAYKKNMFKMLGKE